MRWQKRQNEIEVEMLGPYPDGILVMVTLPDGESYIGDLARLSEEYTPVVCRCFTCPLKEGCEQYGFYYTD